MRSLLMIMAVCCVSTTAIGAESAYLLNPGDELLISVWKEEDLRQEVLVLPDGTISFPLTGQVAAEGLTPRELEEAVANKLRHYIPDPMVSVSVVRAAGHKIYVIGEVNSPGEYQPERPLDVMQALSLAGGLTAFASDQRIIVLRHEGDREMALPFPYRDIQDGRRLDLNFELKSGDVVVVPGRSLF